MAECLRFMRDFEERGIQTWNEYERDNSELLAAERNWLAARPLPGN
jgi:hypothetical protein